MNTRKSLTILVLLAVAVSLLVTAQVSFGQEVTAAIVGTVTDPSGAPVSGVAITASDTQRGTKWTSATNESGGYVIPRVPIGNYKVEAEANGFQKALYPPFTLVL